MLDATPAAETSAVSIPVPPAPSSEPVRSRSKAAALLAAASALLPELEAGRKLDAAILRQAMTGAFGASDAQGAWVWKDAYEAAEAALVLFLRRWGQAMRREAGGAAAMLAMLETLAALEPSQTRRSGEQLQFQQFSTPLPLAYCALQAASVRPGDIVLEPSAGTGMLAVMAECALGSKANGTLNLNEIAAARAGLLSGLFPNAPVTRHNAEAIGDRLPALRPGVVLMNPPFSVSPGIGGMRHGADLRHIRSAFATLAPGGRLVSITSRNCLPGDADWMRAFARLDTPPRVVFSIAIEGRAYARRGTAFDTRLTVLDRGGEGQRIERSRDLRTQCRRIARRHRRERAAEASHRRRRGRRPAHGRPFRPCPRPIKISPPCPTQSRRPRRSRIPTVPQTRLEAGFRTHL